MMIFQVVAVVFAAILCNFSQASPSSLIQQQEQYSISQFQQMNSSNSPLIVDSNYFNQNERWSPIRRPSGGVSPQQVAYETLTTTTIAPNKLSFESTEPLASGTRNESRRNSINFDADSDETDNEDVFESAASEQKKAPPCANKQFDSQVAAASSPQQVGEEATGLPNFDDEDSDEQEENNNVGSSQPNGDLLSGNESVSLESSIAAPRDRRGQMNEANAEEDNEERASEQDEQNSVDEPPPQDSAEGGESMPGASEQEAAEASEAEAANQSALDEQQQQQRAIIMAQAQSEAKAIKEQQEALLQQQIVQQQMLMKRNQNDMDATSRAGGKEALGPASRGSQLPAAANSRLAQEQRREELKQQRQSFRRRAQSRADSIEFSDQPNRRDDAVQVDGYARATKQLHRPAINQILKSDAGSGGTGDDELAVDYSVRQPILSSPLDSSGPLVPMGANLVHMDLMPTAYHNYGSHYGSLSGHHSGGGGGGGKYYQFAESHKKGQFDSGFKRGNKKFHISGHSSQHKNHAEGHVKWHGKKGKGTHYWAFKHKDKKHHKGGHYY